MVVKNSSIGDWERWTVRRSPVFLWGLLFAPIPCSVWASVGGGLGAPPVVYKQPKYVPSEEGLTYSVLVCGLLLTLPSAHTYIRTAPWRRREGVRHTRYSCLVCCIHGMSRRCHLRFLGDLFFFGAQLSRWQSHSFWAPFLLKEVDGGRGLASIPTSVRRLGFFLSGKFVNLFKKIDLRV